MFEVFEEERPKKAIVVAVHLPGVDDTDLERSIARLPEVLGELPRFPGGAFGVLSGRR